MPEPRLEPQPVFVDGPLRGQDYPVPRDSIKRGIFRYAWYDDDFRNCHEVTYQLRQYGLFLRGLWAWTVAPGEPDPADLFDALMSPAAKAAVFTVAGQVTR